MFFKKFVFTLNTRVESGAQCCDFGVLNLPSVCRGQSISRPVVPVDLELLNSVHSFESSEALQGHLGSSGHELQELGSIRLVEGTQGSPEPLDLQANHTMRQQTRPSPTRNETLQHPSTYSVPIGYPQSS